MSTREKELLDKIMHLRRKIIAHSDEEEMHFCVDTIDILNGEIVVPHMQFDEGLFFSYEELRELELFLRRLKDIMAKFFIDSAKKNPELFNQYKTPKSMSKN